MRVRIRDVVGPLSVAVFGATAACSLAALPDLHIALGEAFPVSATGEAAKAATKLEDAGGVLYTGAGVKIVLTWTVLSPAGTYVATFSGVKKGTKNCNTKGDTSGTVKLSDAVNAVFVEFAHGLKIALLLLVGGIGEQAPVLVECEGLDVEVKGKCLGVYNGALNSQITEFKVSILGTKGQQLLTKYENDAGTLVEAVLLAEGGAGFVRADINISEELTFKTNKMIEILG